ncbi:MAG TPA: RidA family protein [Candidatus Bipolaricaulis anaerobius]|nr:RidA family protein [Candidatus Bipolaricaulis anaerobius]HNS23705.1 RidA family protein [Candidatus Bipolaricaulis anaerobius]
MLDYEERVKELGLAIPAVPPAAGAYVPAIQSGRLVFCSGQGPYQGGSFAYAGQVGSDVSLEEAYQAARIAGLNCLAEIRSVIGSLNRISRIVQIRGFVNSAPDFHDQPKVVNGASELMLEMFGESGKHARCALGTNNLPGNIPVEIEMIVELKEEPT